MSFLEPQSWEDVDSAGVALDWTTRQDKLLYPGYEMLRLALVERCEASGTSVPAVLNTARSPGRIYTGDWFSNFHNTISTLIPKFVNHTDSGGDWDGKILADIAPDWTEANILTEIGDLSRISSPEIPFASWSVQQYKILNELLWIKNVLPEDATGQANPETRRSGSFSYRDYGNWADTWAAALAAYNAASWVGGWDSISPGNMVEGVKGGTAGSPGSASLDRFRSKSESTKPTDLYSCSFDWYIFTYHAPFVGAEGSFNATGLPITEDTWWKYLANDGPHSGTGPVVAGSYPTIDTFSPPEPPAPVLATAYEGWRAQLQTAVLKWNITGGFKFVA